MLLSTFLFCASVLLLFDFMVEFSRTKNAEMKESEKLEGAILVCLGFKITKAGKFNLKLCLLLSNRKLFLTSSLKIMASKRIFFSFFRDSLTAFQ